MRRYKKPFISFNDSPEYDENICASLGTELETDDNDYGDLEEEW